MTKGEKIYAELQALVAEGAISDTEADARMDAIAEIYSDIDCDWC